MHIKHVNLAKGFRGGERQTLNLIEGLASLGVSQTLVCRPSSEMHIRAEALGIPIRTVAHPLLSHMAAPRSNLIHVHEARGTYWAALEFMLRKTPYLITRRIPNPISGNAGNLFVYRHAAALVGVSSDVAARLETQTGRKARAILDCCTPHAVDADRTAAIRRELGGGPVIGHIGALFDHHKGQSILIAAFQELLTSHPDARLILLGDGPDKPEFQRLAGGDARVVFAGFQADIGSWIAAMDVFAFPSREEGLGSSVLDAMLLDTPVVSSDVGGLPELIGSDQRGLLVHGTDPRSWAEAIRRLLADDDLRRRLRDAAKEFAVEHDVKAMTAQYMTLYEEIIRARTTAST